LIKALLNKYKSSDGLKNITKLTSANIIAQLISISTAPILYRIYNKEFYGTLGIYMAIVGVIGVFSTLQYLQTIMLEKEDENAINAMWLNRFINIAFTLIVLFLIIVLLPFIVKWLKNPLLNKWIWFIPFSIFFNGQNAIFSVWANRKKEYNILTFNNTLLAITTPIVSIALGLLVNNETGLFLGLFVGQMFPSLILYFALKRKYNLGFSQTNKSNIFKLAKDYKSFPIYSLPSELINNLTNQLPVFMLNSFVGVAAVGVYNLAVRMLGMPISLIGGSISSIFQQKATEQYNMYGNCRPIFVKTLKSLLAISILPTLIIIFFGPQLFSFVFGSKWHEAGIYAQILIALFMGKLIVSPLSYTFLIAKKQKEDFLWHVWMLVSNIFIFYFMFKLNFGVKYVLLVYSLNYLMIYLIYVVKSYKFSLNYGFNKT